MKTVLLLLLYLLDGSCKYANSCTFAHGDQELRAKNENSSFGGGSENNNSNYFQNPNMNFDPNNPMMMQMLMNPNQFNMGNFPMGMMNPGIFNNN